MSAVLAATAVLAIFVFTLVKTPELPAVIRSAARHLPLPKRRLRSRKVIVARQRLFEEIAREEQAPQRPAGRIVAAFYAPWQQSGLHSLEANAPRITHLMPAWLSVGADGASIDFTDWNPAITIHNVDVLRIAHENHIRVLPVLSNARGGSFDPSRAIRLLGDDAAQRRVAMQLRQWLIANGMQGVNVDFENLPDDAAAKMPAFLAELRRTLSPAGLLVTCDVQAQSNSDLWPQISALSDYVVVMGYDQHAAAGIAGPIASLDWFRSTLERASTIIPPDKLVVGVGNYSYDWSEQGGEAEPLSYQQALMKARDAFGGDAPQAIDFDPAALEPTFNYTDENGEGHEVWMLDGITAANQLRLVSASRVHGVALWALGLEDPSAWQAISRVSAMQPADPNSMREISFPYAVDFIGDGEILQVASTPLSGHRDLDVDPQTGLCTDERYLSFPSAFVIRRSGYIPKKVALTIDDGPSEMYTDQILDVLKQYRAKATFFLIGQNVERDPEIARRIWNEGDEIGSHSYTHPNMGEVSAARAVLELNATQRAIESATGRSTVLFRPPYNADAEPTSREEVLPVIRAAALGYVTVGEYIDPQDWDPQIALPDGTVRRRTPVDIARTILDGVRDGRGNCILLHDGGGNRENTVEALKIVVPQLLREGYQFVTVSDLIGTTRDAVMPAIPADERMLLRDDRFVFGATSRGGAVLAVAFILAIFLGISRVVLLAVLARRARKEERLRVFPAGAPGRVSVLIAAFNEERVIAKTISSVLRGTMRPDEIIVVDDGSSDETSRVVSELAAREPIVRLLHQTNSGKASALNRAVAAASGEILVCIDADTVLHPDAVAAVTRHFHDPRVGAVAGNVKVGNRTTLATKLQSIEYVTSQNLDRRAWALLDAVTVVPGAIGAWRREAVVAAGGYSTDTMAEDMDLTWRLRRAGWRIACDMEAMSFTEAPESIGPLFRQRFRWAYGTLQCLWKHRDALGKHEWFGRAMLPSLWLFQIVFQLLSPVVDVQIVLSVFTILVDRLTGNSDALAVQSLILCGSMFALFTAVDLAVSAVALRAEGESLRDVPVIALQRFFYRQLMYAAIAKSIVTAVQGLRTGWNKLERHGTVAAAEG